MHQAECIVPAKAACGEGLIWDQDRQCLWWVDIAEHKLHQLVPQTGASHSWTLPCLISATALYQDNRLILATANGIATFDPITEHLRIIAHPEPDVQGNRLNDIIAGPDGSLWVGTMSEGAKAATGALYRWGSDGCRTQMTGTTISNGMGWSPDGRTLYFIDSVPGVLYAITDDETRVLKRFTPGIGKPDGMTVDADGTLWIALCDKGAVIGMTLEGDLIGQIDLPCDIVTNCAFGGKDGTTLYITTGTFSMTATERAANPLAGGLFAVQMDVPGPAPFKARWPDI